MRRRLLPVTVLAIALVSSAAPAAAETRSEVDGDVIRITIVVDIVGAKGKTGPDGSPLVDYWEKIVQDSWGAAFDRLPYKGCYKLELEVKLNARGAGFGAKDGNHRIIVGAASGGSFEATGFDGADETTRNSKTGDGTRSLEHDRDGAIPVDAPPTVVAHEFGHLMGLGDDRANGAPKNGRDGTMMVGGVPGVDTNVVQTIDQDLVDRIGEAIRKHLENEGKKLPKCETWEGTMDHTVTVLGSGAGASPCGNPIELQGTVRFVVAPNGTTNATYDVDGCGVSEPHAEFSGTATDEGFSFPVAIVQTNGELIPKVSPTRARATLTNLQGSAAGGAQWVTRWDVRCVDHCERSAAVG